MTRLLQIGLAAAALTAAMPAQATDFVFDTGNGGNNFNYAGTVVNGTAGDRLNVKISAHYRGFDDVIRSATLESFNEGLGIVQAGEGGAGAYHQVDNVGGWEFLVLQFDRSVTLLGDRVNAFRLADRAYIDADQFIGYDTLNGAWNATGGQSTWGQVMAGLTGSTNTAVDPVLAPGTSFTTLDTNFTAVPGLSGKSGNVWLIGAAVGTNASDPDSRNDAFKLAGFMARTVTAVPEPGTWAMMLVGFGMVAGAARYRRRRTTAVIA